MPRTQSVGIESCSQQSGQAQFYRGLGVEEGDVRHDLEYPEKEQ
jgi:hypothetical protein